MHTEEFVLIPKRLWATHQPMFSHQHVKKQALDNPFHQQKTAQLSFLQKKTVEVNGKSRNST